MYEKESQDEFRKDILKIIEVFNQSMDKFKDDLRAEIKDNIKPVTQNPQGKSDFVCQCHIQISKRTTPLPEEVTRIAQEVAQKVKVIMEEYELSEIRAMMVKEYG